MNKTPAGTRHRSEVLRVKSLIDIDHTIRNSLNHTGTASSHPSSANLTSTHAAQKHKRPVYTATSPLDTIVFVPGPVLPRHLYLHIRSVCTIYSSRTSVCRSIKRTDDCQIYSLHLAKYTTSIWYQRHLCPSSSCRAVAGLVHFSSGWLGRPLVEESLVC